MGGGGDHPQREIENIPKEIVASIISLLPHDILYSPTKTELIRPAKRPDFAEKLLGVSMDFRGASHFTFFKTHSNFQWPRLHPHHVVRNLQFPFSMMSTLKILQFERTKPLTLA
jgi:hypothetical protein